MDTLEGGAYEPFVSKNKFWRRTLPMNRKTDYERGLAAARELIAAGSGNHDQVALEAYGIFLDMGAHIEHDVPAQGFIAGLVHAACGRVS